MSSSPSPADPEALADTASIEVEGLRERKKRATRRALRWAALSLVSERGLEHVTTEEIAAEAGVSQRTLFNYFTSKEDVLLGNDPDLGPTLAAALKARPAVEAPLQAIKEVFIDYTRTITMDQEMWRLRMQVVQANPSLFPGLMGASALFARELVDSIAARTGTDPAQDAYPGLVVNVAIAAMRATVQHHAANDFTVPITELIAEALDAVMAGLPQPGTPS